jgi:hypothetical protein
MQLVHVSNVPFFKLLHFFLRFGQQRLQFHDPVPQDLIFFNGLNERLPQLLSLIVLLPHPRTAPIARTTVPISCTSRSCLLVHLAILAFKPLLAVPLLRRSFSLTDGSMLVDVVAGLHVLTI